ncbi:MAG: transposase [Pseudomonadota bacterium]|nr:transposase [Gammaproteobacteria bacterium]MDQ3581450.1 transposase [Pseudomonadota bacterium]
MASSDKSEEFKKRQLIGQAIMAGLLTPQAVGLPGLDDIVLAGTSGGGNYNQGTGDYNQSTGGTHTQSGGNYTQS